MLTVPAAGETRTVDRLRLHYLVERQLAERLRRAPRAERRTLYRDLYHELLRQVPDHPQLTRPQRSADRESALSARLRLVDRFVRPNSVFMQIGAGDFDVSLAVAHRVRHVFAVDMSGDLGGERALPANCEAVPCRGPEMPVAPGHVHVAFSDELFEHLHPADAREHAANVYRALAPGGIYVCTTPNRVSGPHDISKYFDTQARGFHMQEYTAWEMAGLLRAAGFARVGLLLGVRGRFAPLPLLPVRALEQTLLALPTGARTRLARGGLVRRLLGITLCAFKQTEVAR
jgi:SAM-dependent methyltransferase